MQDEHAPLALPVAAYLLLWATASLVNMHMCFCPRAWAPTWWGFAVCRLLWDVFALRHDAFYAGLCTWALLEAGVLLRLARSHSRKHAGSAFMRACNLGLGLSADLVLLAHLTAARSSDAR
jgi:hypothetical protein